MAGTFEGLGVPLHGGYVAYESTGATSYLTVDSDGVQNFTFSKEAADNCFAITVTEGSVITSGYCQALYVSHTTSSTANISTGSAQVNSIAVDLTLGGTIACEAEAMYLYVAGSSPTLTSANINGLNIYIDDLGAAPSSRSALQLHIADGNTASTDAFVLMRIEGSSGAVTNMFEKAGTATNPTNFLKTNATDNMIAAGDFVTSATSTYGMKVLVGATTYYIPLVVNS